MDASADGPAQDCLLTVRALAWVGGNAFGRLTIAPTSIAFEPGPISRLVLRLDGSLVHRDRVVEMATSPLNLGGLWLTLRIDDQHDGLVQSLVGWTWRGGWLPSIRPRTIPFVNVTLYPWQRTRVRRAMLAAGFDPRLHRRWFVSFWRPIDTA